MNSNLDERLIQVVPSDRQLNLQKMEMYAFVHFTVNTFTDKEWGDGTESPTIFNPTKLDADQWVSAIKSAGMRGLILTCKHHDGFCLWPSKYTKHSVAESPYQNGRGDVVKEVADACKKGGIRFGVYLSPWDRNNELYGQGKAYDDYFVAQLRELLSNYGDIFAVWFDGACGEGANGKKQYYDWQRYYDTVRELQPGACIHVCGPDVRWCGNEAGQTRPSEWSVVPARTKDTEKVAFLSQQEDNDEFRGRVIRAQDLDLGSRKILENETELIWYPAEVNTSIRPGWFWHASEDNQVRSLETLIYIYEHSVGGNATFLLNIPPTNEGLFHENDVKRLQEFGEYLKDAYGNNLMMQGDICISAPNGEAGCEVSNIAQDNETYYMPTTDEPVCITATWNEPITYRRIELQEQIRLSQRVESFEVEMLEEDKWKLIAEGTCIGYKKILSFPEVTTRGIRIRFKDVRCKLALKSLKVWK